jgi:hypothetical protein
MLSCDYLCQFLPSGVAMIDLNQISSLKRPGRELDAVIHEVIMRRPVIWDQAGGLGRGIGQGDEPFDRQIYEVLQRVNQELDQIGLSPLHRHGSEGIVPHYSTDLLATEQVIEQLRPRNLVLKVHADKRIQATFDETSGLDGVYAAESTGDYIIAQATAICLAALKLLGQQGVSSGHK